MRDRPHAVHLTKANGRPHPDIGSLPVRPRSVNPVEAVTESHIVTRGDAQLANLVANLALERGEPLRPVFSTGIYTPVLDRSFSETHSWTQIGAQGRPMDFQCFLE
jgi:hypothetical protein